MSEQTPENTETTQPNAPSETPAEPTQLPADHPLVKTLAEQKKAIRDLKAKAARLDEIEESQKTEAQKQAEKLAALEAEVNGYKTREQIAAWKAEVAESTGVPAAALAGSTKEEIEAHAETLKPLLASAQEAPGYRPISGEGRAPALALNGDGIEAALKSALGIK